MYDMKPYLSEIERVINKGPFKDTWESLSNYQVPKWYLDAKFGIFIHWGVYSVPAFSSEWYSRNMYIQGSKEYEHHRKVYGNHEDFGYKDFIPMFKAEHFDGNSWLDLFEKAGANYVVPVAEHHDGFQMYKSEVSKWNAYEMGPKRDILGEIKKACEDRGIIFGVSSHRIEHWFFMGQGKDFPSDVREPMERGDFYWPAMKEADHHDLFSEPIPTNEFLDDWLVRTCELIDKYQPQILYFDWWIQHSSAKPYLKKLAAYYYNRAAEWNKEVVINYKHDAFLFGTAVPDVERGQFAEVKPYVWQTDTAIALNSWCYTENNEFRDSNGLICDLVDIVSKNGRLLLNVGPKADGTISSEDESVLLDIGEWLNKNGEAVYGTDVWRSYGEGPTEIKEGQFTDSEKKNFTDKDFRFTTASGYLYVTVLKNNDEGKYTIVSLGEQDASKKANFHGVIRKVEVMGSEDIPEWSRDEKGLHIKTSVIADKPVAFKITID